VNSTNLTLLVNVFWNMTFGSNWPEIKNGPIFNIINWFKWAV